MLQTGFSLVSFGRNSQYGPSLVRFVPHISESWALSGPHCTWLLIIDQIPVPVWTISGSGSWRAGFGCSGPESRINLGWTSSSKSRGRTRRYSMSSLTARTERRWQDIFNIYTLIWGTLNCMFKIFTKNFIPLRQIKDDSIWYVYARMRTKTEIGALTASWAAQRLSAVPLMDKH